MENLNEHNDIFLLWRELTQQEIAFTQKHNLPMVVSDIVLLDEKGNINRNLSEVTLDPSRKDNNQLISEMITQVDKRDKQIKEFANVSGLRESLSPRIKEMVILSARKSISFPREQQESDNVIMPQFDSNGISDEEIRQSNCGICWHKKMMDPEFQQEYLTSQKDLSPLDDPEYLKKLWQEFKKAEEEKDKGIAPSKEKEVLEAIIDGTFTAVSVGLTVSGAILRGKAALIVAGASSSVVVGVGIGLSVGLIGAVLVAGTVYYAADYSADVVRDIFFEPSITEIKDPESDKTMIVPESPVAVETNPQTGEVKVFGPVRDSGEDGPVGPIRPINDPLHPDYVAEGFGNDPLNHWLDFSDDLTIDPDIEPNLSMNVVDTVIRSGDGTVYFNGRKIHFGKSPLTDAGFNTYIDSPDQTPNAFDFQKFHDTYKYTTYLPEEMTDEEVEAELAKSDMCAGVTFVKTNPDRLMKSFDNLVSPSFLETVSLAATNVAQFLNTSYDHSFDTIDVPLMLNSVSQAILAVNTNNFLSGVFIEQTGSFPFRNDTTASEAILKFAPELTLETARLVRESNAWQNLVNVIEQNMKPIPLSDISDIENEQYKDHREALEYYGFANDYICISEPKDSKGLDFASASMRGNGG